MKKTIFIIILGLLGVLILMAPALAATTISLSPSSITITQGQSFNLIVQVDPGSVKNYTVKMWLQYPAELLEAKSFTFRGGWMALSQAGYDLVDNTNGILIKTAGYPGGFSKTITFGTVSFLAQKAGNGIIKVGSNSIVFDTKNQNVLGDPLSETSVTIGAPAPEKILPKEEIPPVPVEKIPPSPKEEISPPPLFDILIEPVTKQFQKKSSLLILIVVILATLAYIIYRKRRRKIV